jgi:hypothetical protein
MGAVRVVVVASAALDGVGGADLVVAGTGLVVVGAGLVVVVGAGLVVVGAGLVLVVVRAGLVLVVVRAGRVLVVVGTGPAVLGAEVAVAGCAVEGVPAVVLVGALAGAEGLVGAPDGGGKVVVGSVVTVVVSWATLAGAQST